MKTKDFLKKHDACIDGARWALSISGDMSDVWNAMVEQGKHDWLIWTTTRPGVFPDEVLLKLACRFIRKTPLSDGRKVWDLLTDERSRRAVEVAERYADGKATSQELDAATRAAAYAAAADADAAYAVYAVEGAANAANAANATYAAYAAAADADAAAYAATRAAAYAARAAAADADAARAAAKVARAHMISEMGNPFIVQSRAGGIGETR